MAITYPLTVPATPGFTDLVFEPLTAVGVSVSDYTFSVQTYIWPGAAWRFRAQVAPAQNNATADAWVAFLLALNGRQGTFQLGDRTRPTTRGTAAGSKQVGAGAAALSTTLPIQGGSGSFAVGDYLQVLSNLYRVTKVVSDTSVDVWPRLRAAYPAGAAITYTNPVGLFRLEKNEDMRWSVNILKHHGFALTGVESPS